MPVPVPPGLFAETVRALPGSGFRGINVTVPHKEAAHELADERSPAAAAIGAANTLTFDHGAVRAENTDASGVIDSLPESPRGLRALVLGAGGSARAVAWALREAGAEVSVWNRTPERAQRLAAELEIGHAERPRPSDLLVHCTSVGLEPISVPDAIEALGLSGLDPPPTVVDLVYAPAGTPVAAWARDGGASVVEGTEVLVRQGARSLELWTGRAAPVAAMRAAVDGSAALTPGLPRSLAARPGSVDGQCAERDRLLAAGGMEPDLVSSRHGGQHFEPGGGQRVGHRAEAQAVQLDVSGLGHRHRHRDGAADRKVLGGRAPAARPEGDLGERGRGRAGAGAGSYLPVRRGTPARPPPGAPRGGGTPTWRWRRGRERSRKAAGRGGAPPARAYRSPVRSVGGPGSPHFAKGSPET